MRIHVPRPGMTLRVSLMALNASGGSGVSRYVASLSRALDAVAGEFGELELALVTTASGAELISAESIETRIANVLGREPRPVFRLGLEQMLLLAERSQLLHFFDVTAPLLSPGRGFVTTFHDASIQHQSSYFGGLQRAYKRRLYPLALKRASAIVAVSAFARREAVDHFGVDPLKVSVIHSGPGLGPARAGRAEPPSGSPRLLFVGNLTKSKNVPFLVRSFARADVDAELVLAGRRVDDLGEIERLIRLNRTARIRVVANPNDTELEVLYASADAFLFPSRYEGFGFPPLEAMARGCPVLASDIPAVREVSGDGAMLLPLDERLWADAIRRLVTDSTLRGELRQRGRIHVRRFSWQKTARELCRLLLRIGKTECRS
jgi:glycosyltransferase involved in cell wall biosynthesis